MWMRSCAICKALMKKLRFSDSVRCQCGWGHRTRKQLSKMSFAVHGGDKRGAEYMGANLLPCNAAVRLQART